MRAKGSGGAEARIPRSGRDKLAGKWFEKLVALQARLRAPNGCPWDREQTHESLRKFLIEETYEVLDAMEKGDSREFSSELGDLLLQIVFHSILAEETGRFTISDAVSYTHLDVYKRQVFHRARDRAGSAAGTCADYGREAERRGVSELSGLAGQYAARTARVAGRLLRLKSRIALGIGRDAATGCGSRRGIRGRGGGFASASIQSADGGDGKVCGHGHPAPSDRFGLLTPGMEAAVAEPLRAGPRAARLLFGCLLYTSRCV